MFGVHQTRIYCAVAIERPYKSIGYSHLSPALRNQPQVPLLLATASHPLIPAQTEPYIWSRKGITA
jgi:hypothetical protein